MCGIIGAFNTENHEDIVKKAMQILNYRGIDGQKIITKKDYSIAHLLHSIVGFVIQPITIDKDTLLANCEIYNYKELSKKYGLKVKNDAELILKLIQKFGFQKAINKLDGVYAICYIKKDKEVFLARDLIGVKPLWYSRTPFCFSSERKALGSEELNPRQIIYYNMVNKYLKFIERPFFKIKKESKKPLSQLKEQVKNDLINSVKKRIPKKVKIGVLFSGGIDSTLVAFILKKLGAKFTCYTSGVKGSPDVEYAKKVAKIHDFDLKINYFDEKKVSNDLKKICSLIESNNVVKVEVSIPFYYSSIQAKKDGVKVLFSGLGSEELFAGYNRFENSTNINEECLHGLKQLYERDLYRDDVITMSNNIELRLPFLDYDLIKTSLTIPAKYKISDEFKKIIIREVGKDLGINELIYLRKKKAAQYGSKSSKIIEKLSKGFKNKSEFLKQFYDKENLKLGVLFSGGKDSNLALHIMKRQNYEISCLITMVSENNDRYMFQKAMKNIIELQSESLNIPLIFGKTKGVKEEELIDLEKTIFLAKEKYNIDGIVTGALFSNYQRDRIKNICEKLGLKTFSPLWHLSQEKELHELLREGFEFILVKVAALGLNKNWLGKKITKEDVNKLLEIEKKYKINVAGEGGEFESIVLNSPQFSKKLKITKSKIVEEDENTAGLIIEKSKLI